MDNKKKCTLAEFSRRALQRMKDKKIPKKQTLHILTVGAYLDLNLGQLGDQLAVHPNLAPGARQGTVASQFAHASALLTYCRSASDLPSRPQT